MWPAETTDCLVRVERHDARGAAPTREEEEELGDLAAGNDWLASDAAAARASAGDASRPGGRAGRGAPLPCWSWHVACMHPYGNLAVTLQE